MNESQKAKRKFRSSKQWLNFKKTMWQKCNKIDGITLKPLRKGANLHHRNLNEDEYQNLKEEWFLPCNNLTHKMIHWLFGYYLKDPAIIDRLRTEMELMKDINEGGEK